MLTIGITGQTGFVGSHLYHTWASIPASTAASRSKTITSRTNPVSVLT